MPSPTAAHQPSEPADPTETPQHHQQKRLRLSVACNQCRKRKVRCDTKLPKCSHCEARNETCEASDPRYPERGTVVRSVANRKSRPPPAPESAPAHVPLGPNAFSSPGFQLDNRVNTNGASHELERISDISPRESITDNNSRASLSWVSRAYRENAAEHPAGADNDLESPDPEIIVNTDETPYRVKFLGGSSLQGLCSFVDLHLLCKGLDPVSPKFKHGMKHSEEFPFHVLQRLPLLPDRGFVIACIETFVDRVWPLFPLVEMHNLQPDIDHILALQTNHSADFIAHLSPVNIPTLSCIYAIICIGADEMTGHASETTAGLLMGIYGLYGHLVAQPYMASVQALCLLALALRGQMKDGQAWQVLGQAIRIAQSIGLHRTIPKQTGGSAAQDHESPSLRNVELRHRVWWSCFAFERLMQLEAGRPSLVSSNEDEDGYDNEDSEDSLAPPIFDSATTPNGANEPDYFAAWVALSRIMGRISDRLYSRRPRSSLDLFRRVEGLYQSLERWSESQQSCVDTAQLPDGEHGLHGHYEDNDEKGRYLRGFLSMYFHFTRIMLLRLSLIFPPKTYSAELSKQREFLSSSYPKLLNASDTCANSARKTVTECLSFADTYSSYSDEANNSSNRHRRCPGGILFSQTPMFLSVIVLALVLLRRPGRRLARADMELVRVAGEFVDDAFSRWGLGGMPMGMAIHEQVKKFLLQFEKSCSSNGGGGNGTRTVVAPVTAPPASCPRSRPPTTEQQPLRNGENGGGFPTTHLDPSSHDDQEDDSSGTTQTAVNGLFEGVGGMMGAVSGGGGGESFLAEPLEGLEFDDLWEILGVGTAGGDLRL